MNTKVVTSTTQGLHPSRATHEPRRPSEIRFVRHRIFYAKASMNSKANVRLGLRHIHVFNRYPDTLNLEQSVHIAKYMFPKQFGLHNVFTSTVDSRETSQAFKDYTLREKEITDMLQKSKRNSTWLPKRLRDGPMKLIEDMRRRHSKLGYVELLRNHCPTRDGVTPVRMVARFVQSVVLHLICKANWGSAVNQNTVLATISRFVAARKFESISLHEVLQNIKVCSNTSCSTGELMCWQITDIPWLTHGNKCFKNISKSDMRKRTELFAEFMYWLYDSLVIPIIRSNFYVTESNSDKNKLFFYRQDVWRQMTEPTLQHLKTEMFDELRPETVKKLLTLRSLAYGQVRLLPKSMGFRPITNLKKRPEYIQNGRRLLGKSTNSLLTPIFKVLNYELARRPRYLGSSLLSVSSIQTKLAAFQSQLEGQQWTKLYFAKVDVQSCFDTIPPEKVLPLLKNLLKSDLYTLSTSAQVHAPKIHTRARGPSHMKPCVKFTTVGHPAKKVIKVSNQAENASANAHGGSIYVGRIGVQIRRQQDMMQLLTEHLENNIVKLGRKFYRQTKGIPQGSVVSSLLCSVFYGRLESGELAFTNVPGTLLMRLVDDFLLITTDESVATRFLNVMHAGIPDFGITVKPSKTLTNFAVTIHGHQVSSTACDEFPYCGVLINTVSLNVTKDPTRQTTSGIIDSLTIETTSIPGKSFTQKALNALRIQLHPFLFDTSHNSRATVVKNLFDTFYTAALRMIWYVKGMKMIKRPNPTMVMTTIGDMLSLAHRVLRRKAIRPEVKNCRVTEKSSAQFQCSISKEGLYTVGYEAFNAVIQGRQTGYGEVSSWIRSAQDDMIKKIGQSELQVIERIVSESRTRGS